MILDIFAICISAIGIIISAIALKKSMNNDEVTQKINEINQKINQGQIELTIHQVVGQAKKDVSDLSVIIAQCEDNSDEKKKLLLQLVNDAIEREINAYEEACSIYLDKKVDTERFKRNFYLEIRRLCENDTTKEKFNGDTSPYKCIKKVYNEWNDMEN